MPASICKNLLQPAPYQQCINGWFLTPEAFVKHHGVFGSTFFKDVLSE